MPRAATGTIVERETRAGLTTYSVKFRAYGRRRTVTLGNSAEGWTRDRARAALDDILLAIAAGTWRPARRSLDERRQSPRGPVPKPAATQLYAIGCAALHAVKVGVTYDIGIRLAELQKVIPSPLELLAVWELERPRGYETLAHQQLRDAEIHREWFDSRHPLVVGWLKDGGVELPEWIGEADD